MVAASKARRQERERLHAIEREERERRYRKDLVELKKDREVLDLFKGLHSHTLDAHATIKFLDRSVDLDEHAKHAFKRVTLTRCEKDPKRKIRGLTQLQRTAREAAAAQKRCGELKVENGSGHRERRLTITDRELVPTCLFSLPRAPLMPQSTCRHRRYVLEMVDHRLSALCLSLSLLNQTPTPQSLRLGLGKRMRASRKKKKNAELERHKGNLARSIRRRAKYTSPMAQQGGGDRGRRRRRRERG